MIGRIKDFFRHSSKTLEKALSDEIGNPTPRSELFPYRFYDPKGKLYYLNEGIVGFVLEGDPVVGLDDSFYKQISLLFDDQLPYGGTLEVLLLASDDLALAASGSLFSDEIYKKLHRYREEFFREYNLDKENSFKHRNYRLFFSYSNKLGKGGDEVVKFRSLLSKILSGIGISTEVVTAEVFLKLIKEIVNYPEYRNSHYDSKISLSDQICDASNGLFADEEGVITGGDYISRVYEVDNYPRDFSIGSMLNLLGDGQNMNIPSRFAIVYAISNEVSSTNQEAFKKKGEIVTKQASGMLGKFNRILEEEGREWSNIISKNLKLRERFLKRTFMVLTTAPKDIADTVEQSIMSLWRKYDFVIKPLRFFHLPGLLGFCPFLNNTSLGKLYKSFGLKKTALSSEPKALLPIHAEWKGCKKGGVLLTGRRGQVFSWNNFSGGNNYNVCVIGESGSGKSVFLQEFVMRHLAQGVKVFVIDIGRSFEKTCKIMGGDFISFGSNSNISLNPFSNIPDTHNPNQEEDPERVDIAQDSLNYLKKIIAKMTAPIYGTSDIQNALIASNISKLWEIYRSDANIDRLVEILNQGDKRERDLAQMLFEFTTDGNYGRFFNKKSNVEFKKQLTVLEFDELRELPELGGVVMQMLAIQIIQQVYLGDRSGRFLILFDEAWYALENFPLFLSSMAKTVRKYGGSLVLGTQSLKNFYGGDSSDAQQASMDIARMGVIENSAWRVLLRQSGESVESLSKMRLPEHLFNVVKDLNTAPGHYSEMLIYQSEKQYFVGRLMLDKFSQVLYSSSPEVFSKVSNYINQGMATEAAVEKVMHEIY